MSDTKTKKKTTESQVENNANETTAIVLQSGTGNLSKLPAAVQKALSGYEVKRKAGFEPLWIHENEGDYIIGTIISARNAGQYGRRIITMEAKVIGNEKTQEWEALQQQFRSLWLTADLETKLNAEEDGLTGRHVFIRFDGMLTKEENPRLKNDMKLYTVQEFNPKQLER